MEDGKNILSHTVFSQIPFHQRFQGVVPEIASRKHVEHLLPVMDETLKKANLSLSEIDAFAVTDKPGLMGSLLVGLTTAKTLAYVFQKPLIPVNHLVAHIYAAHLVSSLSFPFIGLLVSGGHTLLMVFRSWQEYEIVGTTIDDAIGEAFDKVAKWLDLGYPGGPVIDKLFYQGNPDAIPLPLVLLNKEKDRYHFSYSGLKTAVVYYYQRNPDCNKVDLVASFQKKAMDTLLIKVRLLVKDTGIKRVVIAGGVAANSYLRTIFQNTDFEVFIPPLSLCTDNAAMVAGLAYPLYQAGLFVLNDYSWNALDKILPFHKKAEMRK